MTLRTFSLLLVLSFLFCVTASGQDKTPAANNSLIMLTATVSDCNDRYVSGLKRGAFEITDEKARKEIAFFEPAETRASIGILVDNSGSMNFDRQIPGRASGDTMAYFLGLANPDNEYFLLSFSKAPRLLADWTTPHDLLDQRSNIVEAKGDTALFDACLAAIQKFHTARFPRKILILISDGQDNHSKHSRGDVIKLLQRSDIVLYAIRVGLPSGAGLEGLAVLEELAKTTGGYIHDARSYNEMNLVVGAIAEELKYQYRIGFLPDSTDPHNKWHQVKIKATLPPGDSKKVCVRARRGYYTP